MVPDVHSGVHGKRVNLRGRPIILKNKFIKEDLNEIPLEIIVNLLNGIRNALVAQAELPETESANQDLGFRSQPDIIFEVVNEPNILDSQMYLFEAAGTLLSLMYQTPDQQAALLQSLAKPLIDEMERALRTPMTNGLKDVLPVLQVHHYVMALGSISKGFVDFPNPVPSDWILPPLAVFESCLWLRNGRVETGGMMWTKPSEDTDVDTGSGMRSRRH